MDKCLDSSSSNTTQTHAKMDIMGSDSMAKWMNPIIQNSMVESEMIGANINSR